MSRFDLSDLPHIKIAKQVTKPKEIYLQYFSNDMHKIDANNKPFIIRSSPEFAFVVTF